MPTQVFLQKFCIDSNVKAKQKKAGGENNNSNTSMYQYVNAWMNQEQNTKIDLLSV